MVLVPYLDVARGWIRLRLLNASLARAYDLRWIMIRNATYCTRFKFLTQAKSVNLVSRQETRRNTGYE